MMCLQKGGAYIPMTFDVCSNIFIVYIAVKLSSLPIYGLSYWNPVPALIYTWPIINPWPYTVQEGD